MPRLFQNRRDAGALLAARLSAFADDPSTIVLGLPRGGVPVAFEVATALRAPLEVFVVRKLGAPNNRELAMGAIASGGVLVLNDEVIEHYGISPSFTDLVATQQPFQLERPKRPYPLVP